MPKIATFLYHLVLTLILSFLGHRKCVFLFLIAYPLSPFFLSFWSMSHIIYLWGPVSLLNFPPRWNLVQFQASFSPLAHIWRTEKSYISFTEQILGKEASPNRVSTLCSVTEPAGQHVSTMWLSRLQLDISLLCLQGWSKGPGHWTCLASVPERLITQYIS